MNFPIPFLAGAAEPWENARERGSMALPQTPEPSLPLLRQMAGTNQTFTEKAESGITGSGRCTFELVMNGKISEGDAGFWLNTNGLPAKEEESASAL